MPRGTRPYVENHNTISGVTPGSPSTIDVPVLPGIVHAHDWEYAESGTPATRAVMEAGLEKIEILLNNGSWSEYLVTDILKMNDFYGHTFVDGFLTQFFTDDTRESAYDAEKTAFVPGGHRNPKFRVYVKGSATLPTLKSRLLVEGLTDAGRATLATNPAKSVRPLIKHDVDTLTLTNSGGTPTKITYPLTSDVRSLNFEGADITAIVINVNGVEKYTFTSLARLNEMLKQSRAVAVPQADTWHINFELLGGSIDGIYRPGYAPNGQSFNALDEVQFEIYSSSTNSVRLLMEVYDTPKTRLE